MMIRATKLRVNWLSECLSVDDTSPTLSWIADRISSDPASWRPGLHQRAYRVVIAATADGCQEGHGDIWDSGKIDGTRNVCVARCGNRLSVPGLACFWKVQLWDQDDTPGLWSEPAHFHIGLLANHHWQPAAFIQRPADTAAAPSSSSPQPQPAVEGSRPTPDEGSSPYTPGGDLTLPPAVLFRKEFEVPACGVQRATLYVTAKGVLTARVNGADVSDEYFAPGWTDYAIRLHYRAHDVTALLKPGANCVAAVVADGWYAGYIGWTYQRNHYGKDVALLVKLVLDLADGTRVCVDTDATWRSAVGPWLEADFLMGETYDATREQDGWDRVGFNDAAWAPVQQEPPGAVPMLEAHPAPPVRVWRTVPAVAVSEPSPRTFVFDFGRNFAGVVRLQVRGLPRGTRLHLRFAERLEGDSGMIYTKNLRTARATDTYICRGPTQHSGEKTLAAGAKSDDAEEWTPRFTYHGFQYAELTGWPDGIPPLSTLVGLALSSDLEAAGQLQCSSAEVNALLGNIEWTQHANFMDLPTDCPQRDERLGWTGDAQIYLPTASMFADVRSFFHKWLTDLRDAQRCDGQFPMFAPLAQLLRVLDQSYSTAQDGGPAWADAGVLCPWTLYEVYGDIEILRRSFDSMCRFVDFTAGRCGPDFSPPEKFHCFGDWLNVDDDTPKDLIFLAYAAHSAARTSAAADVLTLPDKAQHYGSLASHLRASFRRNFVSEVGLEQGDAGPGATAAAHVRLKGDSQCGYVLALAFDLLDDPNERAGACERLVSLVAEHGWRLSTGFVGTRDLMRTLSRGGAHAAAYRLLHADAYPSWLFSLRQGATSIWERWDGWTPDKGFQDPTMNSFSHYSFGAVAQWAFENIGGLHIYQPGFAAALIAVVPDISGSPDAITSAHCSYLSASGQWEVDWRVEDGRMTLKVEVPVGARAVVCLPAQANRSGLQASCAGVDASTGDETLCGALTWRESHTTPYSGCAKVDVESGMYMFRFQLAAETS